MRTGRGSNDYQSFLHLYRLLIPNGMHLRSNAVLIYFMYMNVCCVRSAVENVVEEKMDESSEASSD